MTTNGQKRPRVRDRRFALKRTLSGSIILDLRAVEKAMSTSGKVTVERDGRIYAATYTVEGDMVHVKTHTEMRSVALSGKSPEDIARRELEDSRGQPRRH
jgi:CTP:molybdopterin cytidylyltransferase MocA